MTFITMDVSFFEHVPFYSQPALSSSPTSTPSLPISVMDMPKPSPQRFADPPIVYAQHPRDDQLPLITNRPYQEVC